MRGRLWHQASHVLPETGSWHQLCPLGCWRVVGCCPVQGCLCLREPFSKMMLSKSDTRAASLGAHRPRQETQDGSLIWEDATCLEAAKPMSHNCWACALEPGSPHVATARAHGPWILCSTVREATMIRRRHATTGEQLLLAATREKPTPQQRPSTAT